MTKVVIAEEVKDFEMVLSGLRRIDPTIVVKKLTLTDMDDKRKKMAELDARALEILQENNLIQGQREALAKEYHELCKQARAKVKGDYGDDAPELELMGVVRSSQIVRTRRGKHSSPPSATDNGDTSS